MTLTSGSQMFYSICNVSFDNVCNIIKQQSSQRRSARPTVYFDVSILAHKLSTPSTNVISSISSLSKQFVDSNMFVVLVCDNRTYRHHSKKATLVRNTKAEQARIDSIYLRSIIMNKYNDLNSTLNNTEESNNIKNEIKLIEKKN